MGDSTKLEVKKTWEESHLHDRKSKKMTDKLTLVQISSYKLTHFHTDQSVGSPVLQFRD